MSELFNSIANFYGGDSLLKANFTELCFLASDIGRSLVSGDAIEVKYSDAYMTIRKQFAQTSRLDTIVCLSKLAAVMETKLKSIPLKELETLDQMRQIISGASELPKRLDDSRL